MLLSYCNKKYHKNFVKDLIKDRFNTETTLKKDMRIIIRKQDKQLNLFLLKFKKITLLQCTI